MDDRRTTDDDDQLLVCRDVSKSRSPSRQLFYHLFRENIDDERHLFDSAKFLNLRMCALVKNLQLLEILVFRFSFLRTCVYIFVLYLYSFY